MSLPRFHRFPKSLRADASSFPALSKYTASVNESGSPQHWDSRENRYDHPTRKPDYPPIPAICRIGKNGNTHPLVSPPPPRQMSRSTRRQWASFESGAVSGDGPLGAARSRPPPAPDSAPRNGYQKLGARGKPKGFLLLRVAPQPECGYGHSNEHECPGRSCV